MRLTGRPSRAIGIALLILLWIPSLHASPIEELAASGDRAYKSAEYDQAIAFYRQVLESGYRGGAILYNLGNAYFKKGELGKAILYYERAHRLHPNDPDIEYNLALAKSRTVDRIDPAPRLAIWDWLDALRDMVKPTTGFWLSWGLGTVAAVLFSLSLFLRIASLPKILRTASLVVGVVFVLSLGLVGMRLAHDQGPPQAIILADKVVVRTAPDDGASEVFHLHEGTKVTVVKTLDQYYEVRLADGRQGWLAQRTAEVI